MTTPRKKHQHSFMMTILARYEGKIFAVAKCECKKVIKGWMDVSKRNKGRIR